MHNQSNLLGGMTRRTDRKKDRINFLCRRKATLGNNDAYQTDTRSAKAGVFPVVMGRSSECCGYPESPTEEPGPSHSYSALPIKRRLHASHSLSGAVQCLRRRGKMGSKEWQAQGRKGTLLLLSLTSAYEQRGRLSDTRSLHPVLTVSRHTCRESFNSALCFFQ